MNHATKIVCASAAVVALVSLMGCSDAAPETPQDPTTDTTSAAKHPTYSYTVRGKVTTLPSAERPIDDFMIHHEAIHDFKNRDGVVFENAATGTLGMKSMTMPFPVDESVSLDSIEVGDIVEFTFITVWGESYPDYKVTNVTKLAADTKLDFEN